MSLSAFREAIVGYVATAVSISQVVDGYVEGPIESGDLICSWVEVVGKNPEHALEQLVDVRIRVFKQCPMEVAPEEPIDCTDLETVVDQVQAAIAAHQDGDGPWFQEFISAQFTPRRKMVEISILAHDYNAAT
jgi:hypothetical protein